MLTGDLKDISSLFQLLTKLEVEADLGGGVAPRDLTSFASTTQGEMSGE